MDHLTIAPIILPLLAGALMVLAGERRRRLQIVLGLVSTLGLLGLAITLLLQVDGVAPGAEAVVRVYRLGNWPAHSASCWRSTGSRR
ncbi:hypothetical protein ACFQU2_38720 [Siccirubricoccus deserti]